MTGLFAAQQPRFEAHNIPTFPLIDKKPAVKNWLRAGIPASRAFARKYPDAPQVGFALKRAGIAVLDIDTPCENTLADALARHGHTPVIVRSGSGNWQAWYANNNEGRHIRPDADKPIDILADGLIIAPPSIAAKGSYVFVTGSLDDVHSLPIMRNPPASKAVPARADAPSTSAQIFSGERILEGQRNKALFEYTMRQAHSAPDFETVLQLAHDFNRDHCAPPQSEAEIMKLATYVWQKTATSQNNYGSAPHCRIERQELVSLRSNPFASHLLGELRARHRRGESFFVANAMGDMLGWSRRNFKCARAALEQAGHLVIVKPYSAKDMTPTLYRLG